MKQRNLHNILQVGFQRCLYIEEGRRMGNAITFYILEPRVPAAKGIYVKHCNRKGCQSNYSFLIIYLYLCLFVSLQSLKKLLGSAHCNFMYLYMLYARSEIHKDLNIGLMWNALRGKKSVRKSSLPPPRVPRSPEAALSQCHPLIISAEFGHII